MEKQAGWLTSISWELIAPHESQALQNHGRQTLQRLAERGGLSPIEMYCVLNDKPLYIAYELTICDEDEAMRLIIEQINER